MAKSLARQAAEELDRLMHENDALAARLAQIRALCEVTVRLKGDYTGPFAAELLAILDAPIAPPPADDGQSLQRGCNDPRTGDVPPPAEPATAEGPRCKCGVLASRCIDLDECPLPAEPTPAEVAESRLADIETLTARIGEAVDLCDELIRHQVRGEKFALTSVRAVLLGEATTAEPGIYPGGGIAFAELRPATHEFVKLVDGGCRHDADECCRCYEPADHPVHRAPLPAVVKGHCSVCGEMEGHVESYGVPCNAPLPAEEKP